VDRAHDLAHRRDRTAFGFERTQVAVELAGAVADEAVGIDVGTRGREVAVPWLEVLATRADIAISFFVEREVGARERAVTAGGMVDHGDVWFDAFFLDQPDKIGPVAIAAIANQSLGPQAEALMRPLDPASGAGRSLGPDGSQSSLQRPRSRHDQGQSDSWCSRQSAGGRRAPTSSAPPDQPAR
jgi:hypothetical protein